MNSFGVFDLVTGALLMPMQATDLVQVQIQAPIGSGRVVLEGDFSNGRWHLGSDGWPEALPSESPTTSVQHVKYAARKRLEASDWQVTRHRDQIETGQPTSLTAEAFAALLAKRQAIRDASNAIEQMTPIPTDFWQDHYWSPS